MEVKLASRFRIAEKAYVNNYDNYSMHNNYEYHSFLKRLDSPNNDELLVNGEWVARGNFLGHPNDDEHLYLMETSYDQRTVLYKDDECIADGKKVFVWDNFYAVQTNDKIYFCDLEKGCEIKSFPCKSFYGYNAEHQVLAFDDCVYKIKDGQMEKYDAKTDIMIFDKPYNYISVSGTIENDEIRQTFETKQSIARNFVFVGRNGSGIFIAHNNDVNSVRNPEQGNYYASTELFESINKDEIFLLYMRSLREYDGSEEYKENVQRLKKVYSSLYNENIDDCRTDLGETPIEYLSKNVMRNFRVIRDFYQQEYLNKTDLETQGWDLDTRQIELSKEDLKLLGHLVRHVPQDRLLRYDGSIDVLAQIVMESPDLIERVSKTDLMRQLKKSSYRSALNKILQAKGETLYDLGDFAIASNKQFLKMLQKRGFDDHDLALEKLAKVITANNSFKTSSDDFLYETSKILLQKLIAEDKDVITRNVETLDMRMLAVLVAEGLTQEQEVIEKLRERTQYRREHGQRLEPELEHVEALGLFKTHLPKAGALDFITYYKKHISIGRAMDLYDVDFSDFRDVAAPYHLSNGSKTTFLNEMLIYGEGVEAAYALSHGASPFQKIEFARGKKNGMPFAGLFLRAKKDNYKGVKELMITIAESLKTPDGIKIIGDIEKSLGQGLRAEAAVVEIMSAMKEAYKERQQRIAVAKQEEKNNAEQKAESRLYRETHIDKLDELDERNRILSGKEIDEYDSLFSRYDTFVLDGYRVLYNQETLQQLEHNISEKEGLYDLEGTIKKKMSLKDDDREKSLNERLADLNYEVSYDKTALCIKREDEGVKRYDYSDKTIFLVNQFVTQKENELCKEKEKERLQKEVEQKKDQAIALGLPSNIKIWHRSGVGTNCGEGWIIREDGSFREHDKFDPKKAYSRDGYKYWEQVLPGEVVLSWEKGSAASEHEFKVIYMPEEGLTESQRKQILELEDQIQETWKDVKGFSSGKPSPSVGYGWNICGREKPLCREGEQDQASQNSGTEIKRNNEPKQEADSPITMAALQGLMNKFNNRPK